ncbi:MAG: chemotaxis response regulator protein-glutamate methylesterase [Cellvibrionaceae bacterium]|nr:chemotaxis response regulator protein-glutamate methylesterase [Cellvibrionaceae bacterium]
MKTTRVFLVDDSAVVRQVLMAVLSRAPDLQVIGSAADPVFALEKMARDWPDVIVLDVEMPRMDGITFLRKIMQERPTPVVICSSLTTRSAETTLQALAAGAVDIVTKPQIGLKQFLEESAADLIQTVRTAAQARVRRSATPRDALPPAELSQPAQAMAKTTEHLVAIGTSTGGTQALEEVLVKLPRVCPGILIVQHMPEKFTASFAERLNSVTQIQVREAKNNDRIIPGLALIAPGGRHMALKRNGAQYHVEVFDAAPVNRHRPSVDVLFRSMAKFAGRNATGIIMTGMGDDGARGLLEMREAGARTIAQDEETCVVFGMPREAIQLGAAREVLPLGKISSVIAST